VMEERQSRCPQRGCDIEQSLDHSSEPLASFDGILAESSRLFAWIVVRHGHASASRVPRPTKRPRST
jgi:hypothetical protein